ncbi:MAG: ZIP family metal transporter [Gemmatimonadaceae bacterium]|jgi:zinc and cadmium transporter
MPSPAFPTLRIWTDTLLAVLLVSGLPLLVTYVMARRETTLRRWLPHLSAFGAGAVFGAAVGHLIPEAFAAGQSAVRIGLGVVAGFGLFALIERVLAGHDHAHAHGIPLGAPSAHASDSSEADCVHLHPGDAHHGDGAAPPSHLAPLAFLGDATHNFVDGALIAAAFLANPSLGLLTMIAVGLHELPREVGTFGLFLHGGIHPMRAVAYNAMTGVVAMIGAALTLLIGSRVASVTALILPVAAGTYLYIAQVVGRAALHNQHRDPRRWGRLGWSLAGTALVLLAR